MAYKKYIKSAAKAVGNRLRKRYISKKSKALKVGKIARDVMYLKSVLNPEKKRHNVAGLGQIVGQVYQNSNGAYVADVTPNPSVGTGYATRNGSSIKLHSLSMNIQFYDQLNSDSNIKGKILFVQVKGNPQTAGTFFTEMFNPNVFIGGGGTIIDYNSSFNPDIRPQWKLLRSFNFTHRNDAHSTQKGITTRRVGLKFKNYHVRFSKDTNSVENGQIIMIILLDNGNSSATASTLTNIPNQGASTGLVLDYSIDNYYYDN